MPATLPNPPTPPKIVRSSTVTPEQHACVILHLKPAVFQNSDVFIPGQDNLISSPVKYLCPTDVKQIFCFTRPFKATYINNRTRWCFIKTPRNLSAKSLAAKTLTLTFHLRMMPNHWLSSVTALVHTTTAARHGKRERVQRRRRVRVSALQPSG